MRRKSNWRTVLLTAAALLTPRLASAQGLNDYSPADPVLPLPLATTQPGLGGLYLWQDFVFMHQTNPIKDQAVGFRGFQDSDGSITGVPGKFVGTHADALDTNQIRGPGTYEPGFQTGIGWKFEDGSTLSVNFFYLAIARYTAAATAAVPGGFSGPGGADSFLFSPVFNFPNDFAGPANKTGSPIVLQSDGTLLVKTGFQIGDAFALYGIWNGASIMTLELVQRAEGVDITYREPVYETETYRLSGVVGPRYFWIWERFRWRTTSLNSDGTALPSDVAIYENITSNEMYGAFIGCENEWYLGHGFAWYLNVDGAMLIDHVKEKADFQLGSKDIGPQNKRAVLDYTFVPEIEGKIGIAWYLAEGVQLRLDYNGMVFFNTLASPRPVSFNYSGLDPGWDHITRLFDGFTAGLAINF
jgi:hypothetical protein